ncbi:MAG: hypothetical protein GY757_31435 [bacterium]|nr:hypothetical protein [bacterium]
MTDKHINSPGVTGKATAGITSGLTGTTPGLTGLILFFILFQGSFLFAEYGNWVIDVGLSYVSEYKIKDTGHPITRQHPFNSSSVTSLNSAQFTAKGKFRFHLGISHFFNDGPFGLGLDVITLKSAIEVTNNFSSTMEWPDHNSFETNSWVTSGSVRVTPLILAFTYRFPVLERVSVFFSAGPALFPCVINLQGFAGDPIIALPGTTHGKPPSQRDDPGDFDIMYFATVASVKKITYGGSLRLDIVGTLSTKFYDEFFFYGGVRYLLSSEINAHWDVDPGEVSGVRDSLENSAWRFQVKNFVVTIGIKFTL